MILKDNLIQLPLEWHNVWGLDSCGRTLTINFSNELTMDKKEER